MTFRKIVFWAHLVAGCMAGAVILVVASSGILLSFRPQLIRWADHDMRSLPPNPTAVHLPVEQLLAAVTTDESGSPTAITLRKDPAAPAEITFGRERVVMVDVYSGRLLGDASPRVRTFFQNVENLHRWMLTSQKNRDIGKAVTGTSSLLFLGILISGPFLWIPRKWSWKNVRTVGWFKGNLTGRAREYNWHNVIGIWCAPTLGVMVLCGVIMSHQWANDLLFKMTGNAPPVQNAERRTRAGGQPGPIDNLSPAWQRAEQQVPAWRTISLRLPPSGRVPLTFMIDTGDGGRPDQRSQLTLKQHTAEVIRWEPFSSNNAGRQIRAWVRFVHTGEAGGVIGQAIAALSACGAIMLVWTGLFLAVRRLIRARKRSLNPESVMTLSR